MKKSTAVFVWLLEMVMNVYLFKERVKILSKTVADPIHPLEWSGGQRKDIEPYSKQGL